MTDAAEQLEQKDLMAKINSIVDTLNQLIIKAAEKKMVVDLHVINEVNIEPYNFRLLKPDFFMIKD